MDKKSNNTEKIIFESNLIDSLSIITKTVSFLYKDINEEFFKQINLKNEELRCKNEKILKLNKENLQLVEKNKELNKTCYILRFFLGFSGMCFFITFFFIYKYVNL